LIMGCVFDPFGLEREATLRRINGRDTRICCLADVTLPVGRSSNPPLPKVPPSRAKFAVGIPKSELPRPNPRTTVLIIRMGSFSLIILVLLLYSSVGVVDIDKGTDGVDSSSVDAMAFNFPRDGSFDFLDYQLEWFLLRLLFLHVEWRKSENS
jgi:hypothetical protein